jgi:[acyl-carrier-protein] S-malonyltransferase
VRPAIVAGHSLGEYSALVAAGALDFPSALRVVRRRGELMFSSGLDRPGAMAAVIGASPAAVESACAAARGIGVCDVANRNGPDQVVLSGEVDAVLEAMRLVKDAGAKIVKRLNVSGAFHSQLMQEPAAALAVALDEVELRDARVPVVPNVTAAAETRGAALRALLAQQIASPVRWEESMRAFRERWTGPILEVGPGAVLGGLLRRIDRAATCTSVGDRASLEAFLKPLPPGRDGAVG